MVASLVSPFHAVGGYSYPNVSPLNSRLLKADQWWFPSPSFTFNNTVMLICTPSSLCFTGTKIFGHFHAEDERVI